MTLTGITSVENWSSVVTWAVVVVGTTVVVVGSGQPSENIWARNVSALQELSLPSEFWFL